MKQKTQRYPGPYYNATGKRNNYIGEDGVEYPGPEPAKSGSNSNFWSNFSNVTNSLGSLFGNVAGGLSSIIGAKNTTVNYTTDPNQANRTGLYVGIGLVLLVLVLVFAFAFNKR